MLGVRMPGAIATLCTSTILLVSSASWAEGTNPAPCDPMHHGTPSGAKPMHHGSLEIPAGQPVPTVTLKVYPDAMDGVNVEVQVTNFQFAPARVNTPSLTTEGHAHIYVDGKKVARLYGTWFHLPNLKPGQHKITVSLNGNGHEQLTYQGKPIAATQVIQVPVKAK